MPGLGLQRRGATVLVGAVLIALLGYGVMWAPVPYVILEPGPTVDTLGDRDGAPVIEVDGDGTGDPDGTEDGPDGVDSPDGEPAATGELRLTTVSVQPDINLWDAIQAWFADDDAVVPEELFFPPGETRQEVEERNTRQFSLSQTAAETAAMSHLGYPARVAVAEVIEDGPADGVLAAGDFVVAVEGEKVTDVADLAPLVTAHPVGTTLTVDVERDEEPVTVEVTTVPDEEDPDIPRIGVIAAPMVDHPYDLSIELDRIGGPSAGLMFALGIINKIEPEDLTGGATIAGTGSIDAEGTVGPIGGVPQKLVAARDVGATVFLVPAANCAEAAAGAPDGIVLVEVETLAGALADLAALRDGGTPHTC